MGIGLEPTKKRQTVKQHLKELRNRFFVCLISLAVFSIGFYFFYEPIIKLLSKSLGSELYYNTPAGGFTFIIRICTSGAVVLTVPIIVYNLIKFIKPAFEKFLTTKRIIIISLLSTIFALAGASFAYFSILPESISFFNEFNINGLSALINADDYLSFVAGLVAVFAIIFQVPLLMLLADKIKRIPPKKLLKNEVWVILLSVIIAIITPFNYDFFSTFVVAVPIIGLYNISIIIISLRHFILDTRYKSTKRAIIIKPSIIEDFALSELEFSSMKDSLPKLKKTPVFKPNSAVAIDFKVKTIKNAQVEQAQWYQERQQRIARINSNVHVFSDIMPRKSSRVLTLQ